MRSPMQTLSDAILSLRLCASETDLDADSLALSTLFDWLIISEVRFE